MSQLPQKMFIDTMINILIKLNKELFDVLMFYAYINHTRIETEKMRKSAHLLSQQVKRRFLVCSKIKKPI